MSVPAVVELNEKLRQRRGFGIHNLPPLCKLHISTVICLVIKYVYGGYA